MESSPAQLGFAVHKSILVQKQFAHLPNIWIEFEKATKCNGKQDSFAPPCYHTRLLNEEQTFRRCQTHPPFKFHIQRFTRQRGFYWDRPGVALKQAVDNVNVAARGSRQEGRPAQGVLLVHRKLDLTQVCICQDLLQKLKITWRLSVSTSSREVHPSDFNKWAVDWETLLLYE